MNDKDDANAAHAIVIDELRAENERLLKALEEIKQMPATSDGNIARGRLAIINDIAVKAVNQDGPSIESLDRAQNALSMLNEATKEEME